LSVTVDLLTSQTGTEQISPEHGSYHIVVEVPIETVVVWAQPERFVFERTRAGKREAARRN
jgi:hypothetical protein